MTGPATKLNVRSPCKHCVALSAAATWNTAVLGAGRLGCAAAGPCGACCSGWRPGCWVLDRHAVAPLAVATDARGRLVCLEAIRLLGSGDTYCGTSGCGGGRMGPTALAGGYHAANTGHACCGAACCGMVCVGHAALAGTRLLGAGHRNYSTAGFVIGRVGHAALAGSKQAIDCCTQADSVAPRENAATSRIAGQDILLHTSLLPATLSPKQPLCWHLGTGHAMTGTLCSQHGLSAQPDTDIPVTCTHCQPLPDVR